MIGAARAFGLRLVAVLGNAMILMFFSEYFFLNEGPALDLARGLQALPDIAILTLFYGLFTAILLIVIQRFHVRDLAGLLLAGSIFGWATEALVVPVAYEAPPISYIWPSIGWHALVDVLLGWYALRLAMRRLAWPVLALLFAALGVCWAFWASWTWGSTDEPTVIYSTGDFTTIALVSGAIWITGMALADLAARRPFRPGSWEIGAVAACAVILFAVTGLAFLPWSVGLALLVAVTLAALARARRTDTAARDRLAPLASPPPRSAYLAALALPGAAVLTYPVVLDHRLAVPAEDITALLLLVGTGAFVRALVRVLRAGA